jgi:hypothetical protein
MRMKRRFAARAGPLASFQYQRRGTLKLGGLASGETREGVASVCRDLIGPRPGHRGAESRGCLCPEAVTRSVRSGAQITAPSRAEQQRSGSACRLFLRAQEARRTSSAACCFDAPPRQSAACSRRPRRASQAPPTPDNRAAAPGGAAAPPTRRLCSSTPTRCPPGLCSSRRRRSSRSRASRGSGSCCARARSRRVNWSSCTSRGSSG